MNLYRVSIPANVYVGRNFDFRAAPIKVLAQDEKGAFRLINNHKNAVIGYLGDVKITVGYKRHRYLIPHRCHGGPSKNIFFQRTYRIEPHSFVSSKVLCPDGLFHMVYYDKTDEKIVLKIDLSDKLEWFELSNL